MSAKAAKAATTGATCGPLGCSPRANASTTAATAATTIIRSRPRRRANCFTSRTYSCPGRLASYLRRRSTSSAGTRGSVPGDDVRTPGRTYRRRMTRSKDRIWTPGRIAALLAIAVVIAGLAHTRFAHPPGWAAVPGGAHAGQLDLKPCTYPTEKGDVKADCGTLVVPENRADPKSRLIAVPVTRIRSTLEAPGRADLPPRGRPGPDQHDVPVREPLHRQPRPGARRLPRRRRLGAARLSGGRLGAPAHRRPRERERPAGIGHAPCADAPTG